MQLQAFCGISNYKYKKSTEDRFANAEFDNSFMKTNVIIYGEDEGSRSYVRKATDIDTK